MMVTTYIKDGKMRTEIPLRGNDTNISLYTDNKVYQWSDQAKQGAFISVEEAKNSKEQMSRIRTNTLMILKGIIRWIVKM